MKNQLKDILKINSPFIEYLEPLYIGNDKNKIITHLISKGYKYEDIKKIMNNNK